MEQVTVIDNGGKSYNLNFADAIAAVETGAYRYADPIMALNAKKRQQIRPVPLFLVKEKATGHVYEMPHKIDANEAVASGYYVWADPGEIATPKSIINSGLVMVAEDREATSAVPADNDKTETVLDVITIDANSTKAEIQAVLKANNIAYRSNASTANLLQIWEDHKSNQSVE